MHLRRVDTPLWTVAVVNLVLGVPAYFVSFLFAYGFEDHVGTANHGTFLLLVGTFAVVTGVAGACLASRRKPRRFLTGVLVSIALNLVVVSAGSVVSSLHKAEGSVSAGFSTATDVLLPCGLLVASLGLVLAAVRLASRGGRG